MFTRREKYELSAFAVVVCVVVGGVSMAISDIKDDSGFKERCKAAYAAPRNPNAPPWIQKPSRGSLCHGNTFSD